PHWWPDEVPAGGHGKSPLVARRSPRPSLSIHQKCPSVGDGGGVCHPQHRPRDTSMKSVRERMDIESAYREVGTFRGAAEICATTPKTVKRVVLAARRNGEVKEIPHNYDQVRDLVAARVEKTKARISAKRLLP